MPKRETTTFLASAIKPATSTPTQSADIKARTGGCSGCAGELEEQMLQEVLTATYWFDPGERRKPYSASVKIVGRRIDVEGKPKPGDRFERLDSVTGIVPGGGPVAMTTRISGINVGKWQVWAEPQRRGDDGRPGGLGGKRPRPPFVARLPLAHGNTVTSVPAILKTQFAAFASVPGVVPGSWSVLVALGVVVGIAMQVLLVERSQIQVGSALAVSLSASVAGAVGSRIWFLILSRGQAGQIFCRGLCIQGFIAGVVVAGIVGLTLTHISAAAFADLATPGLLIGMAVGRPGCFFTGCCAGRPTASRWGVWATDGRLGIRRIPTQLMESTVSLFLGSMALILVLRVGTAANGAVFIGGLAGYTLFRQLLLPLRAEPRKSKIGVRVVMMASGLVLAGDIAYLILDVLSR